MCYPLSWVEVGGGAHLYHPQCVSPTLGGDGVRGSFATAKVCHPLLCGSGGGAHLLCLPWNEEGETQCG